LLNLLTSNSLSNLPFLKLVKVWICQVLLLLGIVTGVSTSVICELKINTHKTAATATTAAVSSELWYQAKVTVPVDPSDSLKYQSFLGME